MMSFTSSVLMQDLIKLVKNKVKQTQRITIKYLVLAKTSLQRSNCKCAACVNHSFILRTRTKVRGLPSDRFQNL